MSLRVGLPALLGYVSRHLWAVVEEASLAFCPVLQVRSRIEPLGAPGAWASQLLRLQGGGDGGHVGACTLLGGDLEVVSAGGCGGGSCGNGQCLGVVSMSTQSRAQETGGIK